MPKDWRFLSDGLQPASYNMALDEALLLEYAEERIPTLRLYGWKSLSLSLGFSQRAEEVIDIEACRIRKVPFVRRMSGGGVLAHADEITYSIVCSQADLNVPLLPKAGFQRLCSFLIAFYRKLSLTADFARQQSSGRVSDRRSFCLSSCQEYDLLIGGKKIGGNAQRRKRDRILQHGVIPLSLRLKDLRGLVREDISDLKDRTATLVDLCGRRPARGKLYDLLRQSFEETFSCRLLERGLTEAERRTAERLEREKYRSESWNRKNAEAALVG